MPANAIETIAGLSRASGVDEETLRTYQARALLPKPSRVRGRHDAVAYQAEHLDRLRFIGRALQLGLSLESVSALLGINGERPTCGDVKDIALRTRDSIIDRGAIPPPHLQRLIDKCRGIGPATDCTILRELRRPPDG